MSVATHRGLDGLVSFSTLRERTYPADGTRRPIIFVTGGAEDRLYLDDAASGAALSPKLAEVGWPLCSEQFAANPWATTATVTRIGQTWTTAKNNLGCATDSFIGIGTSKGYASLARYAIENPGDVAALVGIVPGIPLITVHDENRAGLAAQIESAWGGLAAWNADKNNADPIVNQAAYAALDIPTLLLYGDSDTIIFPSEAEAYAAAVNAEAIEISGDHTTAAPNIDPDDVREFLEALI